jgi:hypothetical protein
VAPTAAAGTTRGAAAVEARKMAAEILSFWIEYLGNISFLGYLNSVFISLDTKDF